MRGVLFNLFKVWHQLFMQDAKFQHRYFDSRAAVGVPVFKDLFDEPL